MIPKFGTVLERAPEARPKFDHENRCMSLGVPGLIDPESGEWFKGIWLLGDEPDWAGGDATFKMEYWVVIDE